ncbi:tetratricopeptide repeat protein [Lacipirellula limnantheis]|nr:tetratricopeptide repeat protein [Lacipirellula limnantheis]
MNCISMSRRLLLQTTAWAFLALTLAPTAFAQSTIDRIRRHNGVDSGKVAAITPLGVTISKSGVESTVPSEEIEAITFGGEPPGLNTARNALQTGRPQEALESLAKIDATDVTREEVIADVDFYTALAKARLALAGSGAPDAAAADVRAFMAKHGKSFHLPQAIETLGDLLMAAGQPSNARTEYAKLAKAKSPYFELNSALLVGRTYQAEGDHAKAIAEFAKVVASTDDGAQIASLKLAATLDRAVSQAAAGQVKEATAAISDIIAKAPPEDATLLARAYNALGDCYLQRKDPRGALFAFLHVDLLYSQEAESHAKALHELIPLWKNVGRDSRAQEAAEKLAEKYPGSRWAKQ